MSFSYSYRLNAFGWVASQLLKEDNAKTGDEGVGNYGMPSVQFIPFLTSD